MMKYQKINENQDNSKRNNNLMKWKPTIVKWSWNDTKSSPMTAKSNEEIMKRKWKYEKAEKYVQWRSSSLKRWREEMANQLKNTEKKIYCNPCNSGNENWS